VKRLLGELHMICWILVGTFAFGLFGVASVGRAQDTGDPPPTPTAAEVSPFVSLGSATSSRLGVAIRWPLAGNLSAELETGYRHGEMHALSSHVSLLYDLPPLGRVVPYVAGGLGVEQYGVALETSGGSLVTHPQTAISFNAGGGVRVPVSQRWGVRSDARWFNGLGRTAPERWRLYNGVTLGRGRR
jgi:hypothetical protein